MEEVAADVAGETWSKTGKTLETQETLQTKEKYYLMSNLTPTHRPLLLSCLPSSFPLLSMKRTQVINLEQKASGLHGPEAHYVSHNKLEAWTCCE